MSVEVSGINYYPIKSCAGTEANELEVTNTGFMHDRGWMVAGVDGVFMSQRKNPEMALISPVVVGDTLEVSAPAMDKLVLPIKSKTWGMEVVTVHKKPVSAESAGHEAASWFSEYLRADVHLVRANQDLPRFITDRYRQDGSANRVAFADSFAFLLTNEASLDELNTGLEVPVPMNRFRPNIVVRGAELGPFEEDYWREIRIGSMRAFVVRACARCAVPDTDQATGLRPNRPVTAALSATRHGVDMTDPEEMPKGNFFGQNLNHAYEAGQTIKVGDEVVVLDRSEKPNFLS